MNFCTFNIEHNGNTLKVTQAALEYLADVNPTLEWEKRGFKATGYHQSEIKNYQKETVQKIQNTFDPEKSETVQKFVLQVLDVYDHLVQKNFSPIRDRLGDAGVYFITGPPRTGGTYLLKSLVELRNEQIKNYNHKLIFDHVPHGTQLGSDYGVQHTAQIIFEWAQWFVWMFETFDTGTHNFIPKKHIGVIFQLGLFEDILGDRANFIITTRHPGEAYQSYVERFLPKDPEAKKDSEVGLWKVAVIPRTNIDEEHWEELSLPDQFLLYWCACYLEVLNYGNPECLTVLQFGEEYNRFLQEFADERGKIYFPEEFDPTEREELPEFSDQCLEMKEKVETLWEEKFGKPLY